MVDAVLMIEIVIAAGVAGECLMICRCRSCGSNATAGLHEYCSARKIIQTLNTAITTALFQPVYGRCIAGGHRNPVVYGSATMKHILSRINLAKLFRWGSWAGSSLCFVCGT